MNCDIYVFIGKTEFVFLTTSMTLLADGCDVYTNLAADPALFEGQGDLQFDVYREMKDVNG